MQTPRNIIATRLTVGVALLSLLFGAPGEAFASGRVSPKPYTQALANPGRLAKDHERDASRKPDQVFMYFEFKPGMDLLDVFTGGGYTTEYASWLVGKKGSVMAFNPAAFESYSKDEVAVRFKDNRLANVTRSVQDMNAVALPANKFDGAIMVQNYHDLYWVKDPNWPKVNAPALLAAIKDSLKPGAVFGIVDHAAAAGTGTSVAGTLHRIEKAAVIKDLEAAGFVFEGEAHFLSNPSDDHTKGVFDDSIRGKTDQFVLKFRKPKDKKK